MADQKIFYFVDTREGAKNEKPFGVTNEDVARSWIKDFNNGEGYFKQVNAAEVEIEKNYSQIKADRKQEAKDETFDKEKIETPYDGMEKTDLQSELEARGIEFKKSGPESTNDFYRQLLVADDKQ